MSEPILRDFVHDPTERALSEAISTDATLYYLFIRAVARDEFLQHAVIRLAAEKRELNEKLATLLPNYKVPVPEPVEVLP